MGLACSLNFHVTGPHTIGLLPLGYTKPLKYSLPVETEEDLTARIAEAAATIRREPGIFELTQHSLLRLCRLCTEVGGHTFGYLLYISEKHSFFF
jgi:hypothetical protein